VKSLPGLCILPRFGLDAVNTWEKAKNTKELIGLSTTKDVQDAILADKKRNPVIDIIDIRYWHYQADGTVYAPQGGENLSPRQHARLAEAEENFF